MTGAPSASSALWVVPSERHVERWARDGRRVETREHFRARLFEALVRDRSLATRTEARIALAQVLPGLAGEDRLLAALGRRAGRDRGAAWERTLDAIDAALGSLRAAAVPAGSLARVARDDGGGTGSRARLLLAASRAVDALLDARGLIDPRGMGALLAERISAHPAPLVMNVARASGVIARFVLDWDGADVAWWRALDTALVRAGGEGTRVELPSFDERIDASRDRGPLDVVSEEVARALDAPPRGIAIAPRLGDLRFSAGAPAPVGAIESRSATDVDAQARAVLDAVRRTLLKGHGPEEIAITAGELDDVAVAALRRAFDEERIPLYDARGEAPAAAGVVSFALHALTVGERGMRRLDVATVARSRYLDPERLATQTRELEDLARALERTPSAAADDPSEALGATARRSATLARGALTPEREALVAGAREALALRLAEALLPPSRSMGRLEHVASARALFARLGVDPLRGARTGALRSDAPVEDLVRVELRAFARDARAWELLEGALSDYEAAVTRLGLEGEAASPQAFRHELGVALDARAGRPGAARAGAVRIVELGELSAETLALLVVIDANDGALPSRGGEGEALLHEGVVGALRAIDPVRAPPSGMLRASREMTALALAATNAGAVVFTRRSRDEEGAVLAASPVVAWLERNGAKSSVWRASPLDGPAASAYEALLRRVARASVAGAEEAGAGPMERSFARRARIERAREARFELASPPVDPILGDLDDGYALPRELVAALAVETGGGDRPLAVTSLERFATCPFQGFASQVLHARPERPLRELPDRRESGTLIHRALAAAFTATAPLWSQRPRPAAAIHEGALLATEGVLQEEAVASPLRRLALARVRDAVRAVVAWSLADETWDFAEAERTFGDGRGWPALVLESGGVRLALRGAIDRLDVGHGRAAVRAIDYKSSPRAAESGMRAFGETAFQVGLYARVAADALVSAERAGLYVGATRPDDAGPKLRQAFEASWSALHACGPDGATAIEARALDVVRRVRQGGIAPRPRDESACATCDASGGCRKPRFAIARDDDDGAGA